MSIATNLQRLVNAKDSIADAIIEKGGTVNSGDGFEEFPADIRTITSGAPPVLISKSIASNGTYNAADDSADGYSSVTVNTPQPLVSPCILDADLNTMPYGSNNTLGNSWYLNSASDVTTDSVTIDGVTYSGLRIGTGHCIKTYANFDSVLSTLEFEFIISELTQDTSHIISTGEGVWWRESIWYSTSDSYLHYTCGWQAQYMASSIIDTGDMNCYDTDITLDSLVGVPTKVKYVKDYNSTSLTEYISLYVNDVKKLSWGRPVAVGDIRNAGIKLGYSGYSGTNMLVTKCKWSAQGITYDNNGYALFDPTWNEP